MPPGFDYYGNFFYLPIYFQSVLAYAPLVSGDLMLSTVGTTSFGSILDGQLMGRWGGTCRASSSASSCELSAQGLSSFHFQIQHRTRRTDKESRRGRRGDWTDAAADAGGHVRQQPKRGPSRDDRAAEIGRTLGGAFGLVVSGAILSNALSRDLTQRGYMDEKEVASLTISMYAPGVGLHHISIFYMYAVCAALALALTAGHASLKVKALPAEQPKTLEASGDDEVGRTNRAERGEAEGQA
ncbi:40S ribosomal protein S20 [Verticillium dahliae VDG2]|nr:40S ribosomal protein S20 [Verticillium dahliae VDG2]